MAEKPITTMAGTVRGGVFSVCVCVYGVWCVPEEELRALQNASRYVPKPDPKESLYFWTVSAAFTLSPVRRP